MCYRDWPLYWCSLPLCLTSALFWTANIKFSQLMLHTVGFLPACLPIHRNSFQFLLSLLFNQSCKNSTYCLPLPRPPLPLALAYSPSVLVSLSLSFGCCLTARFTSIQCEVVIFLPTGKSSFFLFGSLTLVMICLSLFSFSGLHNLCHFDIL